jgi:transcriptional regulator with XRE-family HTH domain
MNPDRIYQQIGIVIRSRRKQLSMTQQQLAAHLGISRASLANIEVGRQKVFVHHLYALAAALRLKPNELLPLPIAFPLDQDWTGLPLPEGLKPEQRSQVAHLVDGVGFETDQKKGGAL